MSLNRRYQRQCSLNDTTVGHCSGAIFVRTKRQASPHENCGRCSRFKTSIILYSHDTEAENEELVQTGNTMLFGQAMVGGSNRLTNGVIA